MEIFSILETYNYGKNAISSRILRNYHRHLWNISLKTIEEKTQVIPCLAGKAHLVVMGDGSVSSCEMLPSVGNIKAQTLDQIKAGKAFKEQREWIGNKRCHCTHNCAMFDSIFFNPASVPHLIRSEVK